MILIYRATTNSISATCREKSVLTNPLYVIKFISDAKKSGDPRYCLVTDTSTYPLRYQAFSVVETNTPTQISNQVKLDTSRSWKYTIYEITSAYAATLSNWTQFSESGLTTVEVGRAKVLDSSPTVKQTYSNYQSTFKEYGG
jgi:hypothetical protein